MNFVNIINAPAKNDTDSGALPRRGIPLFLNDVVESHLNSPARKNTDSEFLPRREISTVFE